MAKLKKAQPPRMKRVVKKDIAFIKDNRIKMKTMGKEGISINKELIDLRYLEQIVDYDQVNALAQIVKYLKKNRFDGTYTIQQAVEELCQEIKEKEYQAFCESGIPGNLVIPRKQEIYATLNRCRKILDIV